MKTRTSTILNDLLQFGKILVTLLSWFKSITAYGPRMDDQKMRTHKDTFNKKQWKKRNEFEAAFYINYVY